MITTYINAILRGGNPGDPVTVRGWIRSKREAKEFAFVDVNDGSCMANIQVVINQDVLGYATLLKQISTGVSIEIEGELVESPAKGQRVEVKASQVIIHGEADPETYPLQKKRHSFEFFTRYRSLAIADQYSQRRISGAECLCDSDPSILPRTRFSVGTYADYQCQRLRGCG